MFFPVHKDDILELTGNELAFAGGSKHIHAHMKDGSYYWLEDVGIPDFYEKVILAPAEPFEIIYADEITILAERAYITN